MSPETTAAVAREPVPVRQRLQEQYANLEQQHECAALGMWVFLVTELLLFGGMFLGLGVYRYLYAEAFEIASEKLNWIVGTINTIVLLVSSLFMVLAVHSAQVGNQRLLRRYLLLTASLGCLFLVFKAYEYYTDYRDFLIPGWRFEPEEWVRAGLRPADVPQVKLFLLFYWIMTGTHAVHVTIGIGAVLWAYALARRGDFTPEYYTPVDVTGLYWHFVDTVWIFLFPMLYLLGTHGANSFHW